MDTSCSHTLSPSRHSYLERLIAHWNADKLARLPQALPKMFKRAMHEQQAAIEAAEGLLTYAVDILKMDHYEVCQTQQISSYWAICWNHFVTRIVIIEKLLD